MVSTKTLNSVLKSLENFILDIEAISDLSNVNLVETKYAIKVLVSYGYVLKYKPKKLNNPRGFYIISESGTEILNSGGFTKQLSMKEISITKIKKKDNSVNNNLNINNSNVNDINQGSFLEKNESVILKQTKVPNKNEKQQSAIAKFIDKWFWLFVIPIVVGIILIAIQFKWFK